MTTPNWTTMDDVYDDCWQQTGRAFVGEMAEVARALRCELRLSAHKQPPRRTRRTPPGTRRRRSEMDTTPTVETIVRRTWLMHEPHGDTHFAVVSRPTICARRADGHRRDIATQAPGVGAAGGRQWEVRNLSDAVHTATGVPRGAMVDKATAERVARAFIAHRAALAPAGEWAIQGASVEVAGLDYLCETTIPPMVREVAL